MKYFQSYDESFTILFLMLVCQEEKKCQSTKDGSKTTESKQKIYFTNRLTVSIFYYNFIIFTGPLFHHTRECLHSKKRGMHPQAIFH